MAELTGTQVARLRDALLAAFDAGELAQLVRVHLDATLATIVPPGKQADVAFGLVGWAQRSGRLPALLQAARAERPSNSEFAALAAELELPSAAAATPGTAAPPASPALPGNLNIDHLVANNLVIGGEQQVDQRDATIHLGDHTEVHTGGGTYIGGNVDTGGGPFVGRDYVAPGDRTAAVDRAFTPLVAVVALHAAPAGLAEALRLVQALQAEAARGQAGSDEHVADLAKALLTQVPAIAPALTATLADPAVAPAVGPVTRYMVKRL